MVEPVVREAPFAEIKYRDVVVEVAGQGLDE